MVVRLVQDRRSPNARGDPVGVGVNQLVAVGIDDLGKYRIVQLLCGSPETYWNAREYSEALGLRPVERTKELLDELTARLILEQNYVGDSLRYNLTTNRGKRRYLARLFGMQQVPSYHERDLEMLAARSLERIKALGRRRKRESLGSSNSAH